MIYALETVHPKYPALLLGMLHWLLLTSEQALQALARRRETVGEILERMRPVHPEQQSLPDYVDVLLDFSLGQLEAEVESVFELLDQFNEAVTEVERDRGPVPASLRLAYSHEGKSVQIMLVGEYDGIRAICEILYNRHALKHGLEANGPYQETPLEWPVTNRAERAESRLPRAREVAEARPR